MNKVLTARFEEALIYATQLHSQQVRKSSNVPYISHLLSVTALVLEDGGDEEQAIAALLHDAIEDQGGEPTRQEIRQRFGDRVGDIVEGCTDSDTIPKPPWRDRKEAYIERFRTSSPEVRRVSLADKLHNARSILAEHRQIGKKIWEFFNGKREGTLWYYRAIVQTAKDTGETGRLLVQLEEVVQELEELS
jgi:(p)ppGpp synthase/HD superfamily hydrolase